MVGKKQGAAVTVAAVVMAALAAAVIHMHRLGLLYKQRAQSLTRGRKHKVSDKNSALPHFFQSAHDATKQQTACCKLLKAIYYVKSS
jgi:hypothetical protein